MTNILIAGGSGTIGKTLSKILSDAGHHVSHLSRNPRKGKYPAFMWDIKNNYIDPKAFDNTEVLINLAGAGVADHRWTDTYKEQIYNSRILTTRFLVNYLSNNPHKINHYIQASAIGIYGLNQEQPTDENAPAASNFLAKVCFDWENEGSELNRLQIKTAFVRIGIVLSKEGGFLATVDKPAKFGMASALGSGQMKTSWIHEDDVCGIFKHILDHGLMGPFNAVAPNIVTNQELTKVLSKVLNRPYFLPNVPAFALKLALGEMADMVLSSQNISCNKIQEAGYKFKFAFIEEALKNIYRK